MRWHASWTQAMTDVRGMGDPLADVTLRTHVTASIGGSHVRLELSNRFGDEPVLIGRVSVAVHGRSLPAPFDGQSSATVAAGTSRWSDPVELTIERGDEVEVDIYLPEPTAYSTANLVGCPLRVSQQGDHVGSRAFPEGPVPTIAMPDGGAIPLSTPLLRGVEVAGSPVGAVVVCLGDSITAGGWPQHAAELLPADARVAVVNRGIGGNRLRLDAGPAIASWGRSGLSRFDEDVLGTAGATDVVIALGTNDLGLPGAAVPLDELPSAAEIVDAYQQLTRRALDAGLAVTIATITPFLPAEGYDEERERIRLSVNEWIRTSSSAFVDFDAAVRSGSAPEQLADEYDWGDHLHPNEAGEARLAEAMAAVIASWSSSTSKV